MKTHRSIATVLVGTTLLATGGASADVLDRKAVKSKEVVGTAAAGDPKPYHALVQGTCDAGFCIVNFGKKGKLRKIRLITCGLITDEVPLLAGVIFGEFEANDVRFFIPVSSVATQGTGSIGVFEFQFTFEVPANTKMQVVMQTDGTPTLGTCTATGSIE